MISQKDSTDEQFEGKKKFIKDEKYGGFAYKIDKNGNPIIKVTSKDGSEILLTFDKALELSTENFLPVPGFIGAKKEPGMLYINKETGQIHFVNDRTNIWRTTVLKTRTGLKNLAQNGFHLFPHADE